MPTYRLLLEYDGSRFHGWQVQPGHRTVQEALEKAVAIACRETTSVVGSGRTDAGVHARGQVAHFSLRRPTDPLRLRRSLNGIMDGGVVVISVDEVRRGFHARFDARRRCYHYYIATQPRVLDRNVRWHVRPAPDFDAMNAAARHLLGTHDFDAFCRARSETTNRVCSVSEAEWRREQRPGDWYFAIVADRFLHGMVRTIVGTLLEIGHEKREAEQLSAVLASRDRRLAGPAVPAHGLVLEEVSYDDV